MAIRRSARGSGERMIDAPLAKKKKKKRRGSLGGVGGTAAIQMSAGREREGRLLRNEAIGGKGVPRAVYANLEVELAEKLFFQKMGKCGIMADCKLR